MIHSDSLIFDDLKGENNIAFCELYKKYFTSVSRFVLNHKGTINDAEDIFQDTLLIFVEKLRKDDFVLTATVKTYLMAIAKHLLLNRLRTTYQETEFTEAYNDKFFEEITISIEEEKNYHDKLLNLMDKITNHCRGIIDDIFFKNKSIVQIQKDYGYSTKHNAINQKHKCIEQIKKAKKQI